MKPFRVVFVLLCMLIAAHPAYAAQAAPAFEDPALEKRVAALAAELRCLVCQNQSLADSNAELAVDLKNEIRHQLRQGQSEAQIVDFMVARYGDFVLYRPPVKATTLALWLAPLLFLLLGLYLLYRRLKGMSSTAAAKLTAAEHERAATLLATGRKEQ